ncbi:RNA polymerase sigma-70 factor (ECF subfamily) [Micromonospora pisi]|uniref:RNA polymerase sigma factor n=1 Tax=Micromonospora pisi TaxID=589240 RepID=A0A495JSZ1_9ACTN|nr:sigma-70 family RNA polymerase sigma factor [Micromonospora pisi]RKR91189.1 RNA polymerase sigma-70 factor (ECF subfamily) [Micromonospora pisi]
MPATGSEDDEITRWALAAKAGDRTAAGAFIRATQRDVHRFVSHLAGPQEAEDLTQETYLRAMRALPRFAARSSARTWLLAIARRVAADHIRALVRRPRTTELSDWQGTVDATGAGFEEGVLLDQLLRTLPRDRREAFVATQVAGLSYAEAALVCDCPVGTIRSRVARARADLVVAMREQGGPEGRLRVIS